jgi:serine/threonine protein kinase
MKPRSSGKVHSCTMGVWNMELNGYSRCSRRKSFCNTLKFQYLKGFLQFHAKELEYWNFPSLQVFLRYYSNIRIGTLLKDGIFAFFMKNEEKDVHNIIDFRMSSNGEDPPPFEGGVAKRVVYEVAKGIDWLHSHNIICRDLKASNVLVTKTWYVEMLCSTLGAFNWSCRNKIVEVKYCTPNIASLQRW